MAGGRGPQRHLLGEMLCVFDALERFCPNTHTDLKPCLFSDSPHAFSTLSLILTSEDGRERNKFGFWNAPSLLFSRSSNAVTIANITAMIYFCLPRPPNRIGFTSLTRKT